MDKSNLLSLAKLLIVFKASFFLTLFIASSAFADNSLLGKVVGITDGDTISFMNDGRAEKVRLSGIDCPERGQDFSMQAKLAASDLVYGKVVKIATKSRDRYGRLIGTVTLPDGLNLNQKLVELGLCWWYEQYAPTDVVLKELEANARNKKKGLWSHANPTPPWDYRKKRKHKKD